MREHVFQFGRDLRASGSLPLVLEATSTCMCSSMFGRGDGGRIEPLEGLFDGREVFGKVAHREGLELRVGRNRRALETAAELTAAPLPDCPRRGT